MLPLIALSLLAAAPATPQLALPGLNGVRLDEGEAGLYGELLTQDLQRLGFKVMSARDVGALLGLERQRELMGCAEGSSCVAEVMGALGAEGVVLGDVALLSDEYTVTVKVLSTKTGQTLALHTGKAGMAKAVPDALEKAAVSLAHQLAQAWQRPELEPKASVEGRAGRRVPLLPFVPIALGAGAVVAGAVLEVQANGQLDALKGASTPDAATLAYGQGRTYETVGWVLLGVGVAAVLAGGAWMMAGGGEASAVSPAVMVTPQGGVIGLAGVLP